MSIILYAEDDLDQIKLLRIALKDQDLKVVEALDGLQAIRKIKTLAPDLILLDLFMPYLDGFGVLKSIKADPNTRHIPIIVLSAWPTGDNRRRAVNAGAVDFVAKPYVPAQLTQLILAHLAQPQQKPQEQVQAETWLERPDGLVKHRLKQG